MNGRRDVFICHAREDKPSVVRPLAESFNSVGISYWLDEAEIEWGDSFTRKINQGLQTSKYVLAVLSPAFLEKPWPQRELDASLNQESSTGEVRVLPLLVGGAEVQKALIKKYPLLNDKFHLTWQGDTQPVVIALQKRLGRKSEVQKVTSDSITAESMSSVYIPTIKRNATQREKDLFLKQAFSTLKAYFQEALQQLEANYPEVEADFSEIHNQKFICTIYLRGDLRHQCKILIGNTMMASNAIVYSEGRWLSEGDNSMNEMAVVEESSGKLGFGLVMSVSTGEKAHGLSQQELAETLWRRFVSPLS